MLRKLQQEQREGPTVNKKTADESLCLNCLERGHEQWHDFVRIGMTSRYKKTARVGDDGKNLKCRNDSLCLTCGIESSNKHNWKGCVAVDGHGVKLDRLHALHSIDSRICTIYRNARELKDPARDSDDSRAQGRSNVRAKQNDSRQKKPSSQPPSSKVSDKGSDNGSVASSVSAGGNWTNKKKLESKVAALEKKIEKTKLENSELRSENRGYVSEVDRLTAIAQAGGSAMQHRDADAAGSEFSAQTVEGTIVRDMTTGALGISGFDPVINPFSEEMSDPKHPMSKFTAEDDKFVVLKSIAEHAGNIIKDEKTIVQAGISVSWDGVLNSSLTHLPIVRTRTVDGVEIKDEGMIFYGFDATGLSVLTSLLDVFLNRDGSLCLTSRQVRSVLTGHISIASAMLERFVDMFMKGKLHITPYFDDAVDGSQEQDEISFVDESKLDDYVVGTLREGDPSVNIDISAYAGKPISEIHSVVRSAKIIGVCFKRDAEQDEEVPGRGSSIALNQLLCEYMKDILQFNSRLERWTSDIWIIGGPPIVKELTKRSPVMISVASYGSYLKKQDIEVTYRPIGKHAFEQVGRFCQAKAAQAIMCSKVSSAIRESDDVNAWDRTAVNACNDLSLMNPLVCHLVGDDFSTTTIYAVSAFDVGKRKVQGMRKWKSHISPGAGPEFQTVERNSRNTAFSTSQIVLSETPDLLTMSISTDNERKTSGIVMSGQPLEVGNCDHIRDTIRDYFTLINDTLNGSQGFGLRALMGCVVGYQTSWGNRSFQGEGLRDGVNSHETLIKGREACLRAWNALLPTVKNAASGQDFSYELTDEREMLSVSEDWTVMDRGELLNLPTVVVNGSERERYPSGFRPLDALDLELIKLSLMGSLTGFVNDRFGVSVDTQPLNQMVRFDSNSIDELLSELKSESDDDNEKGDVELRYDYATAYSSRVKGMDFNYVMSYEKVFDRPLNAEGLNKLRFKGNLIADEIGEWRTLTICAATLDSFVYAGVDNDEADRLAHKRY